MYYIERNDKEVVKYKVHLFEERLNDIRDRLIKDYSSIINIYDYFCFSNIKKLETDNIKNYSNNTLKVNFSYYIYPELVVLVDMLMNNNLSVLSKIIDYKQEKMDYKKINNDNYINVMSNNISKSLDIDFNPNDLKNYLNNGKNIYINNEDYLFLKDEIISCISFERIETVNLKDFYKMVDFLNLNSKDVFDYQIESVRKKTRKK